MSKFWASSSSSDEESDGSDDSSSDWSDQRTTEIDESDGGNQGDGNFRAAPESFSTPPRQPVDDPPEAWRRIRATESFLESPVRRGPFDSSRFVRIACVSDTHGYHRSVPVPPCDLLIHGGDFTNYGEPETVADVSRWFGELLGNGTVRDRIICIAGNHELTFEPERYDRIWKRFRRPRQESKYDAEAARRALTNCTYLEEEEVTVDGVRFYGSPSTPEYYDWAFNVPRSDILSKWERIPTEADVLITHGPPLGRGDVTKGQRVGCVSLMKEVRDRVKPRLHVFGHVHEGRGTSFDGTTLYVNASNVSHNYTKHHRAIVVDLPRNLNEPARLVRPDCGLDRDGLIGWLRERGYDRTARRVEELGGGMTGNELVEDPAEKTCCRLGIHRDEEARVELREAAEELWLGSFR